MKNLAKFQRDKKEIKLYVISDTSIQNRFSHVELAELAIRGGADILQLREKKMKTKELLETAKAMQKICKKAKVLFLVNDRVDIALLSNADGVHLGQEDFPISEARKILGPKKMIGGTSASLSQALELEKQGADYIGFGHIFETQTKAKPTPPKGVLALQEICQHVSIPVVAIGGINLLNIHFVREAKPFGVAVIQAVCGSENPEEAARLLREALRCASKKS